MSIRQAVLLERLRARARVAGRQMRASEHVEEQLRVVEGNLGRRLPELLRSLYLSDAMAGLPSIEWVELSRKVEGIEHWHSANPSREEEEEEEVDLELAPEVIEALRSQPGSYISCGEDGIPAEDPGFFFQLVMGGWGWGWGVELDLATGYVYLTDSDPGIWNHFSFAAPSLEDWLERELDGDVVVHENDAQREDKKLVIRLEGRVLRLGSAEPPHDAPPPLPVTTPSERRQETQRLREETLRIAGSFESERWHESQILLVQREQSRITQLRQSGDTSAADTLERQLAGFIAPFGEPGRWRSPERELKILYSGGRLMRLRCDVLRELYALMDVVESTEEEQASAAKEDGREEREEGVLRSEEEGALAALRPLIEAEVQLYTLIQSRHSGMIPLFTPKRVTHPS